MSIELGDSRWVQCSPALAALHAVRLSCQLFDEVARTHLLHTVVIRADSCIAGGRGPDWARFPALRALRLHAWRTAAASDASASSEQRAKGEAAAAALIAHLGPCPADGGKGEPQGAAAAAAACLARATAVDLGDCCRGAPCLAALAARLPRLASATTYFSLEGCAVVTAATGLRHVLLPGLQLGAADAAALAALPALRTLDLERELRGVRLSPEGVPALAAAAPRLRLLACSPARDAWRSGAAPGCLPNVTHTSFEDCDDAFLFAVDARALVPAVQDLAFWLMPGMKFAGPSLGGLTALRALTLSAFEVHFAPVGDWGAVTRLSGLTRLVCAVDPCDAAWPAHLARLTGLQDLVLDVCLPPDSSDDESEIIVVPTRPLVEAAARMPRLHTLVATSNYEDAVLDWDFGAVARFVHSSPALRRLELRDALRPPLAVASALAMHPRLRRLARDEEDPELFAPMRALFEVAAHMPRLHTLTVTATRPVDEAEWDFGALLHFLRASPALRRVELCGALRPPLSVVGALATHPRLRRLVVSCSAGDAAAAEALAADVYAAGLDCDLCVIGVEEDLGEDADAYDVTTTVGRGPGMDVDAQEDEILVSSTHKMRACVERALARLWAEGGGSGAQGGGGAVVLKAMGRAISRAIIIAEVIKRRAPGLYQTTSIGSVDVDERYSPKAAAPAAAAAAAVPAEPAAAAAAAAAAVPTAAAAAAPAAAAAAAAAAVAAAAAAGLGAFTLTRHASVVEIRLSRQPLDVRAPGYQAPLRAAAPLDAEGEAALLQEGGAERHARRHGARRGGRGRASKGQGANTSGGGTGGDKGSGDGGGGVQSSAGCPAGGVQGLVT
ncbi:MAG: hypothetical protein J3K34DRAFT_527393 [Monoraphidium minutum]|nr:MAG: hypothetical protein J3K34DRAFT_527393 [Monoraphidium minutum]